MSSASVELGGPSVLRCFEVCVEVVWIVRLAAGASVVGGAVGGHDAVDPVDVVGHLGVDAGAVGARAAVAVAGYAVDVPFVVRFLTHERSARVPQTGVAAAALVARTEHIVGDAVQRQQARAAPALGCRDYWEFYLLQCVRYNGKW